MKVLGVCLLLVVVSEISAQRPFYAGLRPIGYPELADRFRTDEENEATTSALGNRFGEDGQPITTTTVRLPVDALGDKELVDRISKWPVDKQPFWYINWKQIEAQRNSRPSTQNVNSQQGTNVNQQQPSSNAQQQSMAGQPMNSNSNQQQPMPVNRQQQPTPVNSQQRGNWDQQRGNWDQQPNRNWNQQRDRNWNRQSEDSQPGSSNQQQWREQRARW